MKVLLSLFLAGVLSANFAFADPLASRDSARRYAKVIPIQEVIDDMLAHYVRDVPVQRRQNVVTEIRKRMNNDKLLETYIDILVSVYTTEELDALANFYSSPVGASANSKRWQVVDKYWMFRGEVERSVKQAASDSQSSVRNSMAHLGSSMTHNGSAHTDTQPQDAAARQLLRAGSLGR